MHLSPLFKKAVTAVALAAAVIAPAGYTALRYERANNRYATCLAQHTGGAAGLFSITDLEGNKVAAFPLLRTYGLEKIGVRAGVIARAQTAKDDLVHVLDKTGSGIKGHFDFVRIAGTSIPTGTWGKGDPVPDASQSAVGAYAQICANSIWVKGPAIAP